MNGHPQTSPPFPYTALFRSPRPGPPAAGGPLVSLEGPPVPLAPAAVQPIAMLLHELATNAAKHGALSVPDGRVAVRWQVARGAGDGGGGGMLRLRWAEKGGPPVAEIGRAHV